MMIDWDGVFSQESGGRPAEPGPVQAVPVRVALGLPPIHAPERGGDNRRYCCECGNLNHDGRCLAAARRQIVASRGYTPIQNRLWRCEGFAPLPDDPDQRPGRERWPGLV